MTLDDLLRELASSQPEKAAVVLAESGESISYSELEQRSREVAGFLYRSGLRSGDSIAIYMENNLRFIEICWAALRSGLYFTAVNRYLKPGEAAYVIGDCGARVLFSSDYMRAEARDVVGLVGSVQSFVILDGELDGWKSYDQLLASEREDSNSSFEAGSGDMLLYSSGTTGKPKGIKRPLPETAEASGFVQGARAYNWGRETRYLSPAPLYHAAPLGAVLSITMGGGTAVVMRRFEANFTLEAIEKFRITDAQFVPTMFVRMLELDEQSRARYDLSSLKFVVHAAAPCPAEIKQQMIDWWGDVVNEYYSSTERNGMTFISAPEWRERPGITVQTGMLIQ